MLLGIIWLACNVTLTHLPLSHVHSNKGFWKPQSTKQFYLNQIFSKFITEFTESWIQIL